MHYHEAETQGVDTFQVPLQGWIVECKSIEDAVAVKRANAILSDLDVDPTTPIELNTLASILMLYGRKSAADALAQRASRIRAAAFLTENLGYTRPN